MSHSPARLGHAWGRPSDNSNPIKPHVGPICAPSHWSMWNTFTVPPWQLHMPKHTKTSPCSNNESYASKHKLVPDMKPLFGEVVGKSPIYVQDSPSPQPSIITISSSSDEGEREDQSLHCGVLAASKTKVEVPSPNNIDNNGIQGSLNQSPSPVYPSVVPVNMPHSVNMSHYNPQVGTSPQRSLMPHSITSLMQPKTSPGHHRPCCQQPQAAVGELPTNLCYLHVPVTVARVERSTPDGVNLGSPNHGATVNHLYPFRRQGMGGLISQLPSSQTAFSPVCAVVSTAAASSPSRVQLLRPCFLSAPSNTYQQNSVLYPHMQHTVQHTTAGDPCAPGGYLMTPAMNGISQAHTCNSVVTDNGITRLGRHAQLHSSPYSTAQLSPQRRVHHISYAGSVLNHPVYQPVEPSSAYLAYTYYGAHRL